MNEYLFFAFWVAMQGICQTSYMLNKELRHDNADMDNSVIQSLDPPTYLKAYFAIWRHKLNN